MTYFIHIHTYVHIIAISQFSSSIEQFSINLIELVDSITFFTIFFFFFFFFFFFLLIPLYLFSLDYIFFLRHRTINDNWQNIQIFSPSLLSILFTRKFQSISSTVKNLLYLWTDLLSRTRVHRPSCIYDLQSFRLTNVFLW